jgi:hypothetical protein
MNKIACFILSYEITKGMKSFGPLGLLKANSSSKELILCQIDSLNKLFDNPDIYVVSGFGSDKMNKKIPGSIHKILNIAHETKNHGYAMRLLLSKIKDSQYSGCFVMNGSILLGNINKNRALPKNSSWILSRKNKKSLTKTKFMGPIMNDKGKLDYIFYDVGEYNWCDTVYFCRDDLLKLSVDAFYDNMFLFEVINKSIVHNSIEYDQVVVPNDSVIMITGIKDKHKIKA